MLQGWEADETVLPKSDKMFKNKRSHELQLNNALGSK